MLSYTMLSLGVLFLDCSTVMLGKFCMVVCLIRYERHLCIHMIRRCDCDLDLCGSITSRILDMGACGCRNRN